MSGRVFWELAERLKVNGVQLNVYDSAKHGGKKEGLTLVFLHGFPGQMSNWKYQVLYFEKKYRVVVYDQRGFGESDKPKQAVMSDYVDDLKALLEFLEIDPREAVLVGHSFGGMVAQLYARDNPAKALVLIGSLTRPRIDFTDYIINYLPSFIWKPLFFKRNPLTERLYPELYFSPSTPLSVWEEFAKDNVDYLQRLPAHVYRYHMRFKDYNAEKWLDKIDVPALVVVGEHDKVAPTEEAERIHRLLKNSRLVVIKDAGHMVLYEKPRELNSVIEGFLENLMGS